MALGEEIDSRRPKKPGKCQEMKKYLVQPAKIVLYFFYTV